MNNQGELILNDSTLNRHQPLNVNMQRSGAANYYVLNAWGERMGTVFPEYFDKILLDAPCSALGTIHSSPEILEWWNTEKLTKLSRVQKQLLISAVKALKVGGELVYSTCTLAPEENERTVHNLLAEYPLQLVPPPPSLRRLFDRGWTEYGNEKFDPSLASAIRIWPHRQQMAGFFAVKLRKLASVDQDKKRLDDASFVPTLSAADPEIKAVLADLEQNWGLSENIWQNFRFVLTRTRLWLVDQSIRRVWKPRFVFAGLLLAEKRLFGWKLHNGSAQVFANQITRRRLRIRADQLRSLFARGRVFLPGLADGYHALEYEDNILACVYSEQGEMRINLPHHFNLIV
jgi:16S rRNA (cytosine1407-C5)-methyltransferase